MGIVVCHVFFHGEHGERFGESSLAGLVSLPLTFTVCICSLYAINVTADFSST